jgi:hypothetical protein
MHRFCRRRMASIPGGVVQISPERHISQPVTDPEPPKSDRRNAALIAVYVGLPTEMLEKIAALRVTDRPAALAEAAAKQAKKFRSG